MDDGELGGEAGVVVEARRNLHRQQCEHHGVRRVEAQVRRPRAGSPGAPARNARTRRAMDKARVMFMAAPPARRLVPPGGSGSKCSLASRPLGQVDRCNAALHEAA